MANPFERLIAAVIALAWQLVVGVLLAPFVGLRRALVPIRVDVVPVDVVIPLRHAVLRAGRPLSEALWDGDGEAATRHFAARWGGEVVGVASVLSRPFPDGDGPAWQLRGMATAPEVRGKGVGRRLLEAIDREVAAPTWCNARTSAAPFYEKHGWTVVSGTFDVPGVGPHVRMVRR